MGKLSHGDRERCHLAYTGRDLYTVADGRYVAPKRVARQHSSGGAQHDMGVRRLMSEGDSEGE